MTGATTALTASCAGPSTSGYITATSAQVFGLSRHWFSSGITGSNAAAAAVAAAAAGASAATAAAARARGPVSPSRRLRQLINNYKQLSKFRLSGLVVATAAAGYAAGSKERIDWAGLGWTSLGTFLCSASANSFNQIYEVVNDSKMRRTAARPLPSGRMTRLHALAFALLAGSGGIALLADKTNSTTAALGAANIFLYAACYTPLKQISVVNTWVGAIVGAVPPLMGWAAAAGSLDVGASILAAGLYFWQMPHFMALAWMCKADYAAGGYRMLSLVDATGRRTAACALRNCAYLFPLGLLATWLGVTSPYFAYESGFITGGMLLFASKFYSSPTTQNARLLFRASLMHLPLWMAAFLAHRQPNINDAKLDLLWRNVRLLGLGSPTEQEREEGAEARAALRAAARERLMLPPPPSPFWPLPEFYCPSKAIAEPAKQQKDAAEAEQQAEAAQQEA